MNALNIHPKIQAAGLGGVITSALVTLLSVVSFDLPAGAGAIIATAVALVCGYLKASPSVTADLEQIAGAVTKAAPPVAPKGDAAP